MDASSEAPDPSADTSGEPSDDTVVSEENATRVLPVDLRDYVSFTPAQPSRVRVLRTDALALDVWCLEPRDVTGVLHLPDQDVTYTVIAGRSWFVTDDGEVGLDPMGAILVPADVVHGFENRSPDPLIVLASCAPPGDTEPDAPSATSAQAVLTVPDRPNAVRRAIESLLGTSRGDRPDPPA